jgi:hypothetical protein
MPRKSANREIGVPGKKIPMFMIPGDLEMTKMGIFQKTASG